MSGSEQEGRETPVVGDWLSFIDSRYVREHCRRIGWWPDPVTASYLVWQCERCTAAERRAGLEAIAARYGDGPVTLPFGEGETSLRRLLERHLAIEKEALELVRAGDGPTVWTLSFVKGPGDHCCWPKEPEAYPSYETAAAAALAAFQGDEDLGCVVITSRSFPDNWGPSTDLVREASARFGPGLEPLRVLTVPADHGFNPSFGEAREWDFFENRWFDVPTPFRPGDLLHWPRPPYRGAEPFVATTYTSPDRSTERGRWLYGQLLRNGDSTDMGLNGCEVSHEDGYVEFHCHQPDPLHMERYDGDLDGYQRKLEPIARFVRGMLGERECAEQCVLIDLETQHERRAAAVREQSDSLRDWFGFDLYAERFEGLRRDGGRIVRRDIHWDELRGHA